MSKDTISKADRSGQASLAIDPNERLARLVRSLARGFSRSLQIRLAEHQVTFGQWTYLRTLWQEDGITQRELAYRMGVMEPTAHAALSKMQEAGYIERLHKVGDRKKVFIYLTSHGAELRSKLEPLALEVNQIATADLDEETVEVVRAALLKMATNLTEDEARSIDAGKTMPSTRQFIA